MMSWRTNATALVLRRPRVSIHLRQLIRIFTTHWKLFALVVVAMMLEVLFHARSFSVPRPPSNLDPPFHVGCQEPVLNTSARANAVLVMLARNSDVKGAVASVRSLQEQFNDHFGYPWVFLNDKEWTSEFVENVNSALDGTATARFETIPASMWGFPHWIDRQRARESMDNMESQGIKYAGAESYHHMCRFQSGFFYDHPALSDYKWYWRVEPDVSFTCAITYDPFIEMERHDKRYGYTIALWELGKTVPSLFRKLSEYKTSKGISTTTLWTAMMDPSYLPWPLRRLIWWLRNRDPYGDLWNLCHFWSNFEIADMDFFRSDKYREFFRFLDEDGGFYYERWGDAPVHSLATALLLRPEQVHHFSDFGYVHDGLQYCTYSPTPESVRQGELVPEVLENVKEGLLEKELGCRCKCDLNVKVIEPTCFNRLKRTVM